MGGFTFNGCGARDYIKKLKYLGNKTCPHCNSVQPFYLVRAKFKISVFFIPTVTLKEKYAIMCEGCQTGTIIDEAEMHRLMLSENVVQNTLAEGTLSEDSLKLQPDGDKTCPNCGSPVNGDFCGFCGTKYQDALPAYRPDSSNSKLCPNCGSPVNGDFCGFCGTKYQDTLPAHRPDSSDNKLCPNCGSPVSGDFCGFCGTKYQSYFLPDNKPSNSDESQKSKPGSSFFYFPDSDSL